MDIPFHRPRTLADAIALLKADSEARPLAGGQTLVAMLNLGYVEPSAIVALSDIAELRGISRLADGTVRIGAMATHAEIARSELYLGGQRLLAHAAGQIADPAIRNFGTIGGACAHADSVSDWPPALFAANARIAVAGPGGSREIAAGDFFQNLFTTALGPAELATAILIPPIAGRGLYRKLARVEGDYATVAIAVTAAGEKGICRAAAIAIGACGPRPVRLPAAEALLVGHAVDRAVALKAGELLARAINPISDVRGSAAYRKRVLPQLVADTLLEALGQ
jgi:carbon-monoxide dehydrogenase medium subunit